MYAAFGYIIEASLNMLKMFTLYGDFDFVEDPEVAWCHSQWGHSIMIGQACLSVAWPWSGLFMFLISQKDTHKKELLELLQKEPKMMACVPSETKYFWEGINVSSTVKHF